MRINKTVGFGLLLSLWLASAAWAAQSSAQLINEAYRRGELSQNQRLLLLVQSIKDPRALADRFRPVEPVVEKSATGIMVEVAANWENFTEEEQTLLRGYLARPSLSYTFDSPGGSFKIHYDLTGTHAVPSGDVNPANGIPDYIDWLADYADSSYRTEVTYLGHLEPPIDFGLGGDNRYDVYVENMPYYGYTQPDGYGSNPWGDWYSYIGIENNFYGFPPNDDPEGDQKGAMKVTMAHEYYHAIQLGYEVNLGSDIWFMEISSTWMEEWAFALVNDNYYYLSDFFNSPYIAMHESNGYSCFIWAKYLEENFGAQVMQEIWDHTIGYAPYEDMEAVLADHSTTVEDEFSEFCLWNYITGTYDDGLHYEDASDYPSIQIMRSHNSFPISGQTPISYMKPDAMASNYIFFVLPSGPGEFTVTFNGEDVIPWRVMLLSYVYDGGPLFAEHEMSLDAGGDGSFVLTDPENWSRLIMIVVNVSQTDNDGNYVYGASFAPYTGYDVDVRATADDSVYSNTATICRFEVENIGAMSDLFEIHAESELGWGVSASPSTLFLNPGEFDSVRVSLTCPPLTMEGVLNTVSLFAAATSTVGADDEDSCAVLVFVQRGDADNSGFINISDATYVIAYVFGGGPEPVPMVEAGDADCNSLVNVSDAVALVSYVFGGGEYPPCNPF